MACSACFAENVSWKLFYALLYLACHKKLEVLLVEEHFAYQPNNYIHTLNTSAESRLYNSRRPLTTAGHGFNKGKTSNTRSVIFLASMEMPVYLQGVPSLILTLYKQLQFYQYPLVITKFLKLNPNPTMMFQPLRAHLPPAYSFLVRGLT